MDVFKLEDASCLLQAPVSSSTASPPDHLNRKSLSSPDAFSFESSPDFGLSFYESTIKKEYPDEGKSNCIYSPPAILSGDLPFSSKEFGLSSSYSNHESKSSIYSSKSSCSLISSNESSSPLDSPPLVSSNGLSSLGSNRSPPNSVFYEKPESSSSVSNQSKTKLTNGRKHSANINSGISFLSTHLYFILPC
jgi:hypothetical protein